MPRQLSRKLAFSSSRSILHRLEWWSAAVSIEIVTLRDDFLYVHKPRFRFKLLPRLTFFSVWLRLGRAVCYGSFRNRSVPLLRPGQRGGHRHERPRATFHHRLRGLLPAF